MKAKHIISIIGVLGTITTLFVLKGSNSQAVKSPTPVTPEAEKLFAGVPLSQLTELAKKSIPWLILYNRSMGLFGFSFKIKQRTSNLSHTNGFR